MSDRFEKFTERARKVLTLAQEEAQRLNHSYIGTEHILLGLIHEGDGVAARVLIQAGLNLIRTRETVVAITGTGERAVFGEIGLTPQAKTLMDESVQEARQLQHHYIGTEHLLLALLNQDGGVALDVLKNMGADPAQLRQNTLEILKRGTFKSSAPTRKVSDVLEAITGVFKAGSQPAEQSPEQFTERARKVVDQFTERARKVLSLAQEEAQRLNHNYIGTEHLLLGLVREGDGVAARVLNNLGVELGKVRSSVEHIIGRGDRPVSGTMSLTPRSKKVIELAVDEARRLNHHYVGTEHLLLGLVREGEGIAAGVLESLGVSLEKVRQQVIQVLNQSTYRSQPPQSSQTPFVDAITLDLTNQVLQTVDETIVGRNIELERVVQVLLRRSVNNPILLGPGGVGKTAIVEEVARRIARYDVPQQLIGCRVILFDQASFAALNRETYLEAYHKFLTEVTSHKTILVMDDFRQFLSQEAGPVGQLLKASIARKELQVIATSSQDDFLDLYKTDWIIERSFQPIAVNELSGDDLLAALQTAKAPYEEFHKLTYTLEALETAIELGPKYHDGLAQPGKALSLLDEAGSRFALKNSLPAVPLRDLTRQLEAIRKDKEAALNLNQSELAAHLGDQEDRLRDRIEQAEKEDQNPSQPQITRQDILETASALYNLSAEDLG